MTQIVCYAILFLGGSCSFEGPDEPDIVFDESLLIGKWQQISNHYYYCGTSDIAVTVEEALDYWMIFDKDHTWETGSEELSVIYGGGTWEYLGAGVYMLESDEGYLSMLAPVFPDNNTMHFNYDTPCYELEDKIVFKMEVAVRK